jgi:Cys-tRNA(Pro)/Cys-tRNA(Cys) deacylase
MNQTKTNAARRLDELGIAYRLANYPVDLDDLSATTVAEKVGMPAEQVWKTLVVVGAKSGLAYAVIAGDAELDLKALARLMGDKNVELLPLSELTAKTGYVRGGVTAIGGRKALRAFVDEEIQLYDEVSVSAGVRGTQIIVAPADYLRAVDGVVGAFARR